MKITKDWFNRTEVSIPKWYGFAYPELVRASDIYYPIPINYIVRYWLRCYWTLLRALYWVGLIDTGVGEMFSWSDFFRIKTH